MNQKRYEFWDVLYALYVAEERLSFSIKYSQKRLLFPSKISQKILKNFFGVFCHFHKKSTKFRNIVTPLLCHYTMLLILSSTKTKGKNVGHTIRKFPCHCHSIFDAVIFFELHMYKIKRSSWKRTQPLAHPIGICIEIYLD